MLIMPKKMKRYLLFILLIVSNLFVKCSCENNTKTLKHYELRIYFADKVLETGKPVPQDIINLFYPIEVDTIVFNANDFEGKQSPFLIGLGNNHQESMAVELDKAVRYGATHLTIKEYIDDKFAGSKYVVPKVLGDNHSSINPSKIDSLLSSFPKNQGVFIYSANNEMSEYRGFKVIHNIDSLRYAIGQKLLENSSQEINVLYGVDLSVKAAPEEAPTPRQEPDSTRKPPAVAIIDSAEWRQYREDSIRINRSGSRSCEEDFNLILKNLRSVHALYLKERSELIEADVRIHQRLLSSVTARCN